MANCKPDFLSIDFNAEDFFATLMRKSFMNSIFPLLPVYFKEFDSYKDKHDRGFLERFLIAHGWEIDQEIIPFIECYLDIIDASVTPGKYLDHLSDVLGNPPDIFNNDSYRNILLYAVTIYKIKGTRRSYELFFSLLGFDVEIYELPWATESKYYDNGEQYDIEDNITTYDMGSCQHCNYYDIIFYTTDTENQILTPDFLTRVRKVVEFLQPIDLKLRNFDFGVKLEDSIDITVTESSTQETEVIPQMYYDNGELYDDGEEFDKNLETPTYVGKLVMKVIMTGTANNQNTNGLNIHVTIPHFMGLEYNNNISQFTLEFYNGENIIHQRSGKLVSIINSAISVQGKVIANNIQLPLSGPQDYDRVILKGQLFNTNGDITKFKQNLIIGSQNVELYYFENE